LTAILEASLDEEDWQDVHNPLGTMSKYCEADGVNVYRSTRLGSISIGHAVLGSNKCVSSSVQPAASSRKVSQKVEALWRKDKSILRSGAIQSPLHLRLNFLSNTNIPLLHNPKPQKAKRKIETEYENGKQRKNK